MSAHEPTTGANDTGRGPRHIAIVMDGNGRWAQRRGKPRGAGHRAGVRTARAIVEACGNLGVPVLTLFAFSSENWRRPATEVRLLMSLFVEALQREVRDLHKNNVQLEFIGDLASLSERLRRQIADGEALTKGNTGLKLRIAVAYGGRWDIVSAARCIAGKAVRGELDPAQVDETCLEAHLSTAGLPDPDLFIRTGGERRISNFLLWNLAYSEMYFSDHLWPDFDVAALSDALAFFANRERRFGGVSRPAS